MARGAGASATEGIVRRERGSLCARIAARGLGARVVLISPYTSIADMASHALPILPGRSMLPLCRGEQVEDWRDAAYCESYNPIWSNDVGDWARTIRTERYRYTFYPNGNGEQLFDLQEDPDEQCNLFDDPDHAEARRDLRDRLLELIVLQDYPKTRRECFALGVH